MSLIPGYETISKNLIEEGPLKVTLQRLMLTVFTMNFTDEHLCVIADFPVSLAVWRNHLKPLLIGHSWIHLHHSCQKMASLATRDAACDV